MRFFFFNNFVYGLIFVQRVLYSFFVYIWWPFITHVVALNYHQQAFIKSYYYHCTPMMFNKENLERKKHVFSPNWSTFVIPFNIGTIHWATMWRYRTLLFPPRTVTYDFICIILMCTWIHNYENLPIAQKKTALKEVWCIRSHWGATLYLIKHN